MWNETLQSSEGAKCAAMKKRKSKVDDDLRPEYDLKELLKGAVRGKYAKRYSDGTNLVLLDPDVHKTFRDGRAVNEALRLVIKLRSISRGKVSAT